MKKNSVQDLQTEVCRAVADRAQQRLVASVRRHFQAMTEPLLSNDPELKNVWNEICVQVQGEHSVYWNGYVDEVERIVESYVSELSGHELTAIWLQTDSGFDAEEGQGPIVDDVVVHVQRAVMDEAAGWLNGVIRRHLDQ